MLVGIGPRKNSWSSKFGNHVACGHVAPKVLGKGREGSEEGITLVIPSRRSRSRSGRGGGAEKSIKLAGSRMVQGKAG
jgi:hypothetical protein